LVGGDIVRGELPADLELSGAMVKAICFSNARDYSASRSIPPLRGDDVLPGSFLRHSLDPNQYDET